VYILLTLLRIRQTTKRWNGGVITKYLSNYYIKELSHLQPTLLVFPSDTAISMSTLLFAIYIAHFPGPCFFCKFVIKSPRSTWTCCFCCTRARGVAPLFRDLRSPKFLLHSGRWRLCRFCRRCKDARHRNFRSGQRPPGHKWLVLLRFRGWIAIYLGKCISDIALADGRIFSI